MMVGQNTVLRWKPRFSFKKAFSKIHEKGLLWCIERFMRDNTIVKIWSSGNLKCKAKKNENILYAFWDHEVSPATFDILAFLVLAEFERIKCGCKSMCVVIVPGPDCGFRRGDLKDYNNATSEQRGYDYMRWRLNNIEIPCCWQIPSCRQVMVCSSREETQVLQDSLAKFVFPRGYSVRFRTTVYSLPAIEAIAAQGASIPSLRPTPQACCFMKDWITPRLGGRKLIVITLRESLYELERNSNLKAWGDFARNLDKNIYYPVILRDTEAVFKPLPFELQGLNIFAEASWNVELRCALYELSYLNMFMPSGPFELSILNRKSRCLVFKSKFYAPIGIPYDSQLKIANLFQKLIWEDDNLEVIQRSFNEMCSAIEENITQKGRI